MAEAATCLTLSASSQPLPDLKCYKCRSSLNLTNDDIVDKGSDQSLIILREDDLPEWIQQKIEEVIIHIIR
jgi:hypothetical protein